VADQDIAEILAGRGCTLDLDDGDMVTDAVVLARVSKGDDGSTVIVMGSTEGTAWLDQFGLVKAADNILSFAAWREDRSDDDE
jgi:hypothetical protein